MIPWLHGCDLLEADADEVLLGLLAHDNEPTPHYVSRPRQKPKPASAPRFDPAEFRRIMAERNARQAIEKQEIFELERARLEELLEGEEEDKKLSPKPAAGLTVKWQEKPVNTVKPPPVGIWYDAPQPKQNVEPWFDPARQPTLGDLRCIAQYTLGYFVAARRLPQHGSPQLGEITTRVECPRDADTIATAMMQIEIPKSALLSAALLDVPEDVMAVVLGCPHVALRVASLEDGKRVSIEVTWDHGAG